MLRRVLPAFALVSAAVLVPAPAQAAQKTKCEPIGSASSTTKVCITPFWTAAANGNLTVNNIKVCAKPEDRFEYVALTDIDGNVLDKYGAFEWTVENATLRQSDGDACRIWGVDAALGTDEGTIAFYYDANLTNGNVTPEGVSIQIP